MPRCIADIFNQIKARPQMAVTVRVAYCEIYNEVFYDLLSDAGAKVPLQPGFANFASMLYREKFESLRLVVLDTATNRKHERGPDILREAACQPVDYRLVACLLYFIALVLLACQPPMRFLVQGFHRHVQTYAQCDVSGGMFGPGHC